MAQVSIHCDPFPFDFPAWVQIAVPVSSLILLATTDAVTQPHWKAGTLEAGAGAKKVYTAHMSFLNTWDGNQYMADLKIFWDFMLKIHEISVNLVIKLFPLQQHLFLCTSELRVIFSSLTCLKISLNELLIIKNMKLRISSVDK